MDACGGKQSDFRYLVGQLRGGIQVTFGLTCQYSLDVWRQPAGPYAPQEVIRHVWCQAL